MMQRIAIVDVGSGNLYSVNNALKTVATDHEVVVTQDPQVILKADKLVLPGQGAMGSWLDGMNKNQLTQAVIKALQTIPTLGICLGMQALMNFSEEDDGVEGLGIFSGQVTRFNMNSEFQPALKIPHMGWNKVLQKSEHPLWRNIESGKRFYFVHSYYVSANNTEDVASQTDYIINFCSAIARNNVFAVQFHPEKSQQQGLQLLHNFVSWNGNA